MGATVAGLTAAQRLAERGFRVTVLHAARSPGAAAIPEDVGNARWAERRLIRPWLPRGRPYPSSLPRPERAAAAVLPAHSRHLRALLADISAGPRSSSETPSARSRRRAPEPPPAFDANARDGATPIRSETEPWVIFPRERPCNVVEAMAAAKQFLADGYTVPDGEAFLTRVMRFLTSSPGRRAVECEGMSMLDYLRGANSSASPRFNYSPRFLADLRGLPDLSPGLRPSHDEARAVLGWYAQWLASPAGGTPVIGLTQAEWMGPWLKHLRRLKVRFVAGALRSLRLRAGDPPEKRPPSTSARGLPLSGGRLEAVLAPGSSGPARRLVKSAHYLILATPPHEAAAACAELPHVGVVDALARFTSRGQGQRADGARWQPRGEVLIFLPFALDLTGPMPVRGSAWALVVRQVRAFDRQGGAGQASGGRARGVPGRAREWPGSRSVVAVEIQAWDVPSSTRHRTAAACDDRELAHEVWEQVTGSLARRNRRQSPDWFMIAARHTRAEGSPETPASIKWNVLPGDWSQRPGPSPRPSDVRSGPQEGTTARAAGDGTWIHWDRLVFAGDYLKTLTRAPGVEAACESGLHAVNAVLQHQGPAGVNGAAVACPVWDPEASEPPAFQPLRMLDQWLLEQRLPHIFEISGLDGWVGLATWLPVLQPATEAFVKSVMELGDLFAAAPAANAPARGAGAPTTFQEIGLRILRRMREALEKSGAARKSQ